MIIFNQNENHIKALSVSVGQGAIEWESLENILQMKISVAKFQADTYLKMDSRCRSSRIHC